MSLRLAYNAEYQYHLKEGEKDKHDQNHIEKILTLSVKGNEELVLQETPAHKIPASNQRIYKYDSTKHHKRHSFENENSIEMKLPVV